MYRGGREKLTGGGWRNAQWRGGEAGKCPSVTGNLTHRHTEKCSYRDAANLITAMLSYEVSFVMEHVGIWGMLFYGS